MKSFCIWQIVGPSGAHRIRMIIAEPDSTLMPYDQAKWARRSTTAIKRGQRAAKLEAYRQTTYHLLKTLPDEVFTYWVSTPYSMNLIRSSNGSIFTRSVPDHIKQLKKTYQAWKERNK